MSKNSAKLTEELKQVPEESGPQQERPSLAITPSR